MHMAHVLRQGAVTNPKGLAEGNLFSFVNVGAANERCEGNDAIE
jgi:hypothetical protein